MNPEQGHLFGPPKPTYTPENAITESQGRLFQMPKPAASECEHKWVVDPDNPRPNDLEGFTYCEHCGIAKDIWERFRNA